jgi:hypothetical protein
MTLKTSFRCSKAGGANVESAFCLHLDTPFLGARRIPYAANVMYLTI